MIKKFSNFKLILEKINKEVFVYFSPTFRNQLDSIKGNKIAKDLLELEGNKIYQDLNFIDIDENEPGYVTFITDKNGKSLLDKIDDGIYITLSNDSIYRNQRIYMADSLFYKDNSDVYKKSRNIIKIGKLVNKLLPKKYNSSEIEEFTNNFKSSFTKESETFKIIKGSDIYHMYKIYNYKDYKGQLRNSCMNDKPYSFFEIYTNNQNVCNMLILTDGDKLIGRALVWKIQDKYDFEYYMDRVYSIDDSYISKFKNYANNMGWAYYESSDEIKFKDSSIDNKISVMLKRKLDGDYSYKHYPFMDTFKYYYFEYGILSNKIKKDETEHYYLLSSTDGSYTSFAGLVWSDYEEEYIDRDSCVFSNPENSYINVSTSIILYGEYYPITSDKIVYSKYLDKYLLPDESIYANGENSYIREDSAVIAITDVDFWGEPDEYSEIYDKSNPNILDIDDFGDSFWYKILSKFKDWSNVNYIHNSILIEDYNGELILDKFKQVAFKVDYSTSDNSGYFGDYLTKIDADSLGFKLSNDSIIIDMFEYFSEKSKYNFVANLKSKIIKILDELNDEKKSIFNFKKTELKNRLEQINNIENFKLN